MKPTGKVVITIFICQFFIGCVILGILNILFETLTLQRRIWIALQRKSHLCIPFLGIARPQSQYAHSCVCERFIYSQDRSTYFPAAE
jgi:hypothetical protein